MASDKKNEESSLPACCTMFAGIGTMFMLLVGLLLKFQPIYIGGIHDYRKAREAAFGAMWMYFFTLVLAAIYLYTDNKRKRREEAIARASYGRPPPPCIQDYAFGASSAEEDYEESVFA